MVKKLTFFLFLKNLLSIRVKNKIKRCYVDLKNYLFLNYLFDNII